MMGSFGAARRRPCSFPSLPKSAPPPLPREATRICCCSSAMLTVIGTALPCCVSPRRRRSAAPERQVLRPPLRLRPQPGVLAVERHHDGTGRLGRHLLALLVARG